MNPLLMLLDEVQNLVKQYPVLVTIVIFIGGYKTKQWLQRDKSRLNQDENEYNHKLKVRLLKTELHTKQLINVYTTLFKKFQLTKKAIGYLFGMVFVVQINPDSEETWKDHAEKSAKKKEDLNDFLITNLIFLSPKTSQHAQELYKKLDSFWAFCLKWKVEKTDKNTLLENKKYLNEVENMMQELQEQMQSELQRKMLD